jgi:Schlafen, AlbA_2
MAQIPNADLGELLFRPRETLDIEIKCWLDLADDNQKADLCKAILAIANHGGGYLVVGLLEDASGSFAPDANRPASLNNLTQDDFQNAIQKYIEPSIQCRTEHVEHPDGHGRFPVIAVPGGHRVPLKAKRGSPDGKLVKDRVYIRRPGPRSEEPQTSAEWDELFERCIRARKEELLSGIRDLLAGGTPGAAANEPTAGKRLDAFLDKARSRWEELVHPLPNRSSARFPDGYWEIGAVIDGNIESQNPAQFRDTLPRTLQHHSCWPPFVFIQREPYTPRLVDNTIESWHGPDTDGTVDAPAHCDFWRIGLDGSFYMRRGYDEDGGRRGAQPKTTFDITTPTWRVGEVLSQINYVASALRADGTLIAKLKWTGLAGRKLVSVGNPNRLLFEHDKCHQETFETSIAYPLSSLSGALPEIVFGILQPLYYLFDFWQLPQRLVEEELRSLLRQQF